MDKQEVYNELKDAAIANLKSHMNDFQQDPDGMTNIGNLDIMLVLRELDSVTQLADILGSTLEAVNKDRNRLWDKIREQEDENDRLYQSLIDVEKKLGEAKQ